MEVRPLLCGPPRFYLSLEKGGPVMSVRICPVCESVSVSPVSQKVTVMAKVDGLEHQAGGVSAYRCESGHIFFVRHSNLESFMKKVSE